MEGIGLEPMTRSFQHAFEVTLFYTNTLLWNIEQSVIFIYTALPTELSLLGKWIHFMLKECPNKVKSVSY